MADQRPRLDPRILGWFARRHGRHTPAALAHDFLVTGDDEELPPDLPAGWVVPPEQADVLFRHMLLGPPPAEVPPPVPYDAR